MSRKVTLGGDRVGSENSMKVKLHGFNRSTHDIGCLFKTDQACGTIVPCFCDIATNGTTYYIELATKVRTLPTNGPIFGRFKHQVDVFHAPIRLYIAALHNNATKIGMNMKQVKLPVFQTLVPQLDLEKDDLNSQQINQSSLLAYLGVRGLGRPTTANATYRTLPAIFLLMYWDVYKNYYSNKQEEIGMVISGAGFLAANSVNIVRLLGGGVDQWWVESDNLWPTGYTQIEAGDYMYFYFNPGSGVTEEDIKEIKVHGTDTDYRIGDIETTIEWQGADRWKVTFNADLTDVVPGDQAFYYTKQSAANIETFELTAVDDMREEILSAPRSIPFEINKDSGMPYSVPFSEVDVDTVEGKRIQSYFSQCGLGLRTYLSDRFNNWLSTEWIDGAGGINEITAVNVTDGSFTINELLLRKKIFDMMNRIAISGGSYNDWQEAVYDEASIRMAESPIYAGGLSSEIVFDEVVSSADATTSAGEDQPLGSLAGRGSDKATKGKGEIKVKIKEPSMLMILESIVPRVDYSQGNKWWNKLETMDDLHKPSLDAIGFQELDTEEICAFDAQVDGKGNVTRNSAGKQPSWIEYMTNIDQSFGSFAANGELEHMAVNRKYSHSKTTGRISDLTTYIDPTLYNNAFADHNLTARNFWVQIAIDCKARRKMSAKQIPNL